MEGLDDKDFAELRAQIVDRQAKQSSIWNERLMNEMGRVKIRTVSDLVMGVKLARLMSGLSEDTSSVDVTHTFKQEIVWPEPEPRQ